MAFHCGRKSYSFTCPLNNKWVLDLHFLSLHSPTSTLSPPIPSRSLYCLLLLSSWFSLENPESRLILIKGSSGFGHQYLESLLCCLGRRPSKGNEEKHQFLQATIFFLLLLPLFFSSLVLKHTHTQHSHPSAEAEAEASQVTYIWFEWPQIKSEREWNRVALRAALYHRWLWWKRMSIPISFLQSRSFIAMAPPLPVSMTFLNAPFAPTLCTLPSIRYFSYLIHFCLLGLLPKIPWFVSFLLCCVYMICLCPYLLSSFWFAPIKRGFFLMGLSGMKGLDFFIITSKS